MALRLPSQWSMVGRRIRMQGTVQGVGFRPWVYRIALQTGVTGEVHHVDAGEDAALT